jgi:hypothetical protein
MSIARAESKIIEEQEGEKWLSKCLSLLSSSWSSKSWIILVHQEVAAADVLDVEAMEELVTVSNNMESP